MSTKAHIGRAAVGSRQRLESTVSHDSPKPKKRRSPQATGTPHSFQDSFNAFPPQCLTLFTQTHRHLESLFSVPRVSRCLEHLSSTPKGPLNAFLDRSLNCLGGACPDTTSLPLLTQQSPTKVNTFPPPTPHLSDFTTQHLASNPRHSRRAATHPPRLTSCPNASLPSCPHRRDRGGLLTPRSATGPKAWRETAGSDGATCVCVCVCVSISP